MEETVNQIFAQIEPFKLGQKERERPSKGEGRTGQGYDLAWGIREGCLEEVTLKLLQER